VNNAENRTLLKRTLNKSWGGPERARRWSTHRDRVSRNVTAGGVVWKKTILCGGKGQSAAITRHPVSGDLNRATWRVVNMSPGKKIRAIVIVGTHHHGFPRACEARRSRETSSLRKKRRTFMKRGARRTNFRRKGRLEHSKLQKTVVGGQSTFPLEPKKR